MAEPLSPEEEASLIGRYWGLDAPAAPAPQTAVQVPPIDMGEIDDHPYQPNPNAPGYQPNPGIAQTVAPPAPAPAQQPVGARPSLANEFKTGAYLSDVPMNVTRSEAPVAKTLPPVTVHGAPARPAVSGPSNPDPFGVRAAEKKMVGSYDTQRDAQTALGANEASRAHEVSDLERERARRRRDELELSFQEQEQTAQRFQKTIDEANRQIDDVRTKRIRPMRMMSDSGLQAAAIVGGILGGLSKWAHNSDRNPFLESLDRMIDRQMAADERNIDNESRAIGQKMNLLQQQVGIFHDMNLSKLQYRNLHYEAMKDEIEAEAKKYDSPMYAERAKDAVAILTREQGGLQRQIGKEAEARSAAAVSREMARVKEVRDFRNNVYDKVLAAGHGPAMAEAEADRQTAIAFGLRGMVGPRNDASAGGDPVSMLPKNRQDEGAKEYQAHAAAEQAISAIRKQFEAAKRLPATAGPWDRDREGIKAAIAGGYKQALGPGMSSDEDYTRYIEPNLPKYGEDDATRAGKQARIEAHIRSKVATPTLDANVPGWRNQTTDETNAALGAKPLRR